MRNSRSAWLARRHSVAKPLFERIPGIYPQLKHHRMAPNGTNGPQLECSDRAAPDRAWGYIGFVASLVSFGFCGFLSPVSLVISLAGLRKYPVGYALAGIALSLIQLSVILFAGLTPSWMIVCTGVGGAAAMIAGMKRFA